jgi:aspartate/methionine/tyrosine aminotransferase
MGLGDGFYRIKRLPPYVFAQVQSLKLEARQKGEDIIDFGMGNPDQPTPSHIVEKMIEAARKGKNHRYSASRGITKLRHAIAGWYKRNYDVELDPETETIVTIGSKEGLAHLALALIGPGDVVLTPTPTYPIRGEKSVGLSCVLTATSSTICSESIARRSRGQKFWSSIFHIILPRLWRISGFLRRSSPSPKNIT